MITVGLQSMSLLQKYLDDTIVLIHLHDQAVSEKGWRRRNVYGWRFRAEVEKFLGKKFASVFPRLVGRGWVDRVDVREPGRGQPQWMYRISVRGARALEGLLEWDQYPIEDPWPFETDAGALYAPMDAWKALEVLRRQAVSGIGVRRFGMPGWMTATEIRQAAWPLVTRHIAWLLEHRMVERRRPDTGGAPTRPPWFYRITALGMRVELINAPRIKDAPPELVHLWIFPADEPTERDVEAAWTPVVGADSLSSPEDPKAEGKQNADRGEKDEP